MKKTPMSSVTEPERKLWRCLKFALPGEEPFMVDTDNCPLGLHRFKHWNRDGTCNCPKEANGAE